ncbi:MAG: flagellar hook-basal body complex protein FliE [Alteraurantiacibacter sp.]|nr:flagellar hook-basal body complex protein FliE [Alteraurantiacibacter sp.]
MSGIGSAGGAAAVGLQQILALRRQVAEQSEALRSLREAGAAGNPQQVNGAGSGFAETLRSTLEQVNAAQVRSSEITAAYERGEVTDIAQVMLARQESSVAFEATLQVRNKLLSAYQDIMRMGV